MTKEETKVYNKAYSLVNKETISARHKAYNKVCNSTNGEKRRAYYQKHKEKLSEYRQKYYAENKEKLLILHKNWYLANIEKERARVKKYKKDHPDSASGHTRKRKALKLGCDHEKYNSLDIFERDNWVCHICGQKINKRLKWPNPRSKSIDHIIPLTKGGADAPVNLAPAHLRCNISKGAGGQLRLIG